MYSNPDLVPVVMFLSGAGIAITAMILRSKRNQLEHQQRMTAMEKGIPLPESPITQPKEKNPYFWGFVFIAFGLALSWYFLNEYSEEWFFAPMFLLVGIAVLAANLLHRRDAKKSIKGEKVNGAVILNDDSGDVGSSP